MKRICVTGHAGYKGSVLVPKLVKRGYEVRGLDLLNRQDIRNADHVASALNGCDAVIHLACLSNDPTADLNPELARSINLESFQPFLDAARKAGIKKFIYASSSAVYGVKKEKDVTEDLPLEPITDYARYKAMCEKLLLNERDFERVIIRPATVCGLSPNLRLDLAVHILTMAALRYGEIKVFGGSQYRPNIHIDDITDAYITLLEEKKVDGEIFNVGTHNMTIAETAEMVASIIPAKMIISPSSDNRSYHVSSKKFDTWFPRNKKSIESAICGLAEAYHSGFIPNPDDSKYYRVRGIKEMGLT